MKIPGCVSIQNPAWSPDGKSLCLTDWRGGYNKSPARVIIYNIDTRETKTMAGLGHTNVSQPGSCWHARSGIILSSDRYDTDQVCRCHRIDGVIERLTFERGFMAYEPSWHPDGERFVYERHVVDQEGSGRIMIGRLGTRVVTPVTTAGDSRQPNWSTHGLVYQTKVRGVWWVNVNGKNLYRGTDATWHPDGRVLYSDDDGELVLGKTRLSFQVKAGYRGAPSVSPDGKWIACEAYKGDPDGGPGTWLEILSLS